MELMLCTMSPTVNNGAKRGTSVHDIFVLFEKTTPQAKTELQDNAALGKKHGGGLYAIPPQHWRKCQEQEPPFAPRLARNAQHPPLPPENSPSSRPYPLVDAVLAIPVQALYGHPRLCDDPWQKESNPPTVNPDRVTDHTAAGATQTGPFLRPTLATCHTNGPAAWDPPLQIGHRTSPPASLKEDKSTLTLRSQPGWRASDAKQLVPTATPDGPVRTCVAFTGQPAPTFPCLQTSGLWCVVGRLKTSRCADRWERREGQGFLRSFVARCARNASLYGPLRGPI